MKLHQVIDRQHGNVVAAAFEHPDDWSAQSAVTWTMQHVSFPVLTWARAAAPDGVAAVELLPAEAFYWLQPDYGLCRPGTNQLGQTAMPPLTIPEAFGRWIVPKFRGKCLGLRMLGVAPMPEALRGMAPAPNSPPPEAGCATIEYDENGRRIEEILVGVKVQNQVPYYGPQGTTLQINWGFARLYAMRAAKGELAGFRATLENVVRSVRVNPAWERLCGQVMKQLRAQFDQYLQAGYSQIQAAGQLSRQISANNDAMLAGFEQQRQAAARSAAPAAGRPPGEGFDEYIRGVETVNDPYHGTSQQDATYQYHWTDGSGNYQHSNDPFFNPNIGSGLSWTLMDRPRG